MCKYSREATPKQQKADSAQSHLIAQFVGWVERSETQHPIFPTKFQIPLPRRIHPPLPNLDSFPSSRYLVFLRSSV